MSGRADVEFGVKSLLFSGEAGFMGEVERVEFVWLAGGTPARLPLFVRYLAELLLSGIACRVKFRRWCRYVGCFCLTGVTKDGTTVWDI